MSFTTDYFTSKRKNYIFNHELCFNSVIIYVNEITSGEVELNPTAFVWNVAATYKLNQKHYLSAGANTAFRSPNIDDMRTLGIVDFRYEIPSKDLSPEKSMNYEFGCKADYDDFYAGISVFRNNPTDFIARVRGNLDGRDSVNGYPVFLKENSSEAYIEGAEFNTIFRLYELFITEFAINYTYGQNNTKNEPTRRIPPIYGSLGLEYQHSQVRFRLEWLYSGKQNRLETSDKSDNRIGPNGTDSWNVINVLASYRWITLTFGLSLINLTDELYRYHGSGVDMHGRSFKNIY
jgi:outer membrane receptor protein involved in Fe transport